MKVDIENESSEFENDFKIVIIFLNQPFDNVGSTPACVRIRQDAELRLTSVFRRLTAAASAAGARACFRKFV